MFCFPGGSYLTQAHPGDREGLVPDVALKPLSQWGRSQALSGFPVRVKVMLTQECSLLRVRKHCVQKIMHTLQHKNSLLLKMPTVIWAFTELVSFHLDVEAVGWSEWGLLKAGCLEQFCAIRREWSLLRWWLFLALDHVEAVVGLFIALISILRCPREQEGLRRGAERGWGCLWSSQNTHIIS